MTLNSSFRQSVRRLKPEKHRNRLHYRDRAELVFLAESKPPFPSFLLDTTVYIDTLQARIPEEIDAALRSCILWHCSVTEAELALSVGHLNPADPRTVALSVRLRNQSIGGLHTGFYLPTARSGAKRGS